MWKGVGGLAATTNDMVDGLDEICAISVCYTAERNSSQTAYLFMFLFFSYPIVSSLFYF